MAQAPPPARRATNDLLNRERARAELALADLRLAGGRVGVDEAGLPGPRWAELSAGLPGRGAACPASGSLRSIRSVKTGAEVERLRHAARVTTAAIVDAIGSAGPGT